MTTTSTKERPMIFAAHSVWARRLLDRIPRFDITNAAGDVFMRRYKLIRTSWFNLYLHEILRSDEDRCLHDHPWRFATLILWGGYWAVIDELNLNKVGGAA